MPDLRFTTDIACPPETVFALINDLTRYSTWLPSSSVFGKVAQLTNGPVGLGTAYVDQGPSLAFQGEVIQWRPPAQLTFYQASRSRLFVFDAGLNITIEYVLYPTSDGTRVERTLQLETQGAFTPLRPLLMRGTRSESQRILQHMKSHLESQPVAHNP